MKRTINYRLATQLIGTQLPIFETTTTQGGIIITSSSTDSRTTPVSESFPLPALIGGIAGLLALIVFILVIVIVVVSIKRRNIGKSPSAENDFESTDDQAYDYPDELSRPLPQPETNDHEIQVTTDNDSPDHNYETTMDTVNPAYGITLSASACIPIDTNIAYGMIEVTAAQQQGETPPAPNPTFEDAVYELANCPSVTHPTYKQEVYNPNY